MGPEYKLIRTGFSIGQISGGSVCLDTKLIRHLKSPIRARKISSINLSTASLAFRTAALSKSIHKKKKWRKIQDYLEISIHSFDH